MSIEQFEYRNDYGINGCNVKVSFSIDASQVSLLLDLELNKRSKSVEVKGFRPGKVPVNILENRYGLKIAEEVKADAINFMLDEVIKNNKLDVCSDFVIDGDSVFQKNKDFKISFSFDVYPEVNLDFNTGEMIDCVEINYDDNKDSLINEFKTAMLGYYEVDDKNYKAQDGDQVFLECSGDLANHENHMDCASDCGHDHGNHNNCTLVLSKNDLSNILIDGIIGQSFDIEDITAWADLLKLNMSENAVKLTVKIVSISKKIDNIENLNLEHYKKAGLDFDSMSELEDMMAVSIQDRLKKLQRMYNVDLFLKWLKENRLDFDVAKSLVLNIASISDPASYDNLNDDEKNRLIESAKLFVFARAVINKYDLSFDERKFDEYLNCLSCKIDSNYFSMLINVIRNNNEVAMKFFRDAQEFFAFEHFLSLATKNTEIISYKEFSSRIYNTGQDVADDVENVKVVGDE